MAEQSFVLLDLASQGAAVQRTLKGLPTEQKLQWIAARGKLIEWPKLYPDSKQTYHFESWIGLETFFFIDDDEVFVFIGDHFTYTAREYREGGRP